MSEKPNSLEILKDLLLREERAQQYDHERDLQRLEDEIKVREKLEQNMEPILMDWFMRFRRDFPREFGHLFYQTLESEIQENPERIKAALHPIVDDMIGEHFNNRFRSWRDRLGFGRINKLKDPTELYREKVDLPESDPIKVEEKQKREEKVQISDIFVLENDARNLLGMRSRYNAVDDQEVTSLMLDTIRRMVEDAVLRKGQALDWVDFNGYKIYLITFKRISVATTVTGHPEQDYMNQLEDRVMEFAKMMLPEMHPGDFDFNSKLCIRLLAESFPKVGKS
ncbi:hypothetical protein [Croceimicrobium sp.]|uniref:hypothetical protein n=1 Tax=Croceimicrobium sp. TaxID=2828340 RepID=UPI003BA8DE75